MILLKNRKSATLRICLKKVKASMRLNFVETFNNLFFSFFSDFSDLKTEKKEAKIKGNKTIIGTKTKM